MKNYVTSGTEIKIRRSIMGVIKMKSMVPQDRVNTTQNILTRENLLTVLTEKGRKVKIFSYWYFTKIEIFKLIQKTKQVINVFNSCYFNHSCGPSMEFFSKLLFLDVFLCPCGTKVQIQKSSQTLWSSGTNRSEFRRLTLLERMVPQN